MFVDIKELVLLHATSRVHGNKINLKFPDQKLEGRFHSEEMQTVAHLAMSCVQLAPKDKPSITEIVEVLSKMRTLNTC